MFEKASSLIQLCTFILLWVSFFLAIFLPLFKLVIYIKICIKKSVLIRNIYLNELLQNKYTSEEIEHYQEPRRFLTSPSQLLSSHPVQANHCPDFYIDY